MFPSVMNGELIINNTSLLFCSGSGIVTHRNDPEYPQCPPVNHLSASEKDDVIREWRHKCKQFTDCSRKTLLKKSETTVDDDIQYTGVISPRLQTMAEVSGSRLQLNDTFPNKEVLAI